MPGSANDPRIGNGISPVLGAPCRPFRVCNSEITTDRQQATVRGPALYLRVSFWVISIACAAIIPIILFGAFYFGPLPEALLALPPAFLLAHQIVGRRLRNARINAFRGMAE